jgi:uncharacterized protein YjbI with pentapeptide repeats
MDLITILDRLQVIDADLGGSRFSNAKLLNSSFTNVNLQGASFTDVSLSAGSFTNATLSNLSISDSNLNGILVSDLIARTKRVKNSGRFFRLSLAMFNHNPSTPRTIAAGGKDPWSD